MKTTTHDIGTGTHNLSVNVPLDEWQAIKDAAAAKGVTMGQFMRSLILTGAEHVTPAAAAKIRAARSSYYAVGAAAFVLALSIFAPGFDARRSAGRVRPIARKTAIA